MQIRYGFDITVTCAAPTPMVCLLTIHDDHAGAVIAPETFMTVPAVPSSLYADLFGNLCRRFVAPPGDLQLWGDGTVQDSGRPDTADLGAAETLVAALPDDTLVFLMGSRYCETDRLSQTAWDLFGATPPGWGRVQAVCDFVHRHITFGYGNACATRTAYEAYHERVGVCRDYAHLAIALLRCLNIPARYVNGYLGDIGVPIVDPADFSAWIEVHVGGRWWTFDPRNNKPRIGRIVVARGRDAADIPLINSFGPHILKAFRVWTYELDDPAGQSPTV